MSSLNLKVVVDTTSSINKSMDGDSQRNDSNHVGAENETNPDNVRALRSTDQDVPPLHLHSAAASSQSSYPAGRLEIILPFALNNVESSMPPPVGWPSSDGSQVDHSPISILWLGRAGGVAGAGWGGPGVGAAGVGARAGWGAGGGGSREKREKGEERERGGVAGGRGWVGGGRGWGRRWGGRGWAAAGERRRERKGKRKRGRERKGKSRRTAGGRWWEAGSGSPELGVSRRRRGGSPAFGADDGKIAGDG
ncbi:hypothetical protein TIFTF001_002728 [Ficus carica]|uniref:Uncharacterized protein n=1 Tax=Ficus carica TaxID=3494 RepID=A0AA87ZP17_FICCA|nr:hypothetical protein TIFTF001_002728 [Ficus carica]